MRLVDVKKELPVDWNPMDIYTKKYELVRVQPHSYEFQRIMDSVFGSYYRHIEDIYRIQNPFMYIKYLKKMRDYELKGPCEVKRLYHDTPRRNLDSIACFNFDWRFGNRFKYGPGVYFSSNPHLANKHSCKLNEVSRSMFLVDVLVQNIQVATKDIFVPDFDYDTVVSQHGATYVKYFDNEYYPAYVINYQSM